MITFAAFTPHSPLLLKPLEKRTRRFFGETLEAMQKLSEELYASHPDVILTISTHRGAHKNAFSANVHEQYYVDFQEFGDHSTRSRFEPDLELTTRIEHSMRSESLPFTLDSDAVLDYGIGIPLTLLHQNTSEHTYHRSHHVQFPFRQIPCAVRTHFKRRL